MSNVIARASAIDRKILALNLIATALSVYAFVRTS
jgi:hypothetical protein